MDATSENERGLIGDRLRLRRKMRSMSLKEVSERSKLSIGLLSQIERGLTTPSIRSMRAICDALEMPVAWLFSGPSDIDQHDKDYVVRKHNRRELIYKDSSLRKEILTPDTQPSIQMMRFTLAAGADSGEPYSNREGGKCGIVLGGTLNLQIGEIQTVIHTGDSFAFPADTKIRFWNEGEETCEVIWVVAPAMI